MTIKELYEWAIEHRCENLDLYKKTPVGLMQIYDYFCWLSPAEAPNETIVVIE